MAPQGSVCMSHAFRLGHMHTSTIHALIGFHLSKLIRVFSSTELLTWTTTKSQLCM